MPKSVYEQKIPIKVGLKAIVMLFDINSKTRIDTYFFQNGRVYFHFGKEITKILLFLLNEGL